MTKALKKDRSLRAALDAAALAARRPVLLPCVILGHGDKGPELICIPLRSGEGALPVFSSIEAAQNFIFSNALGWKWCAREYFASELVWLLGLCTDVDWVLFDPLPCCLAAGDAPAKLMRWESFIDCLLG